jgi:hypothetical protein
MSKVNQIRVRTGSLSGDTFKDIVDEGVEDSHRLVRDTSIGVDLFQDCIKARVKI